MLNSTMNSIMRDQEAEMEHIDDSMDEDDVPDSPLSASFDDPDLQPYRERTMVMEEVRALNQRHRVRVRRSTRVMYYAWP